LAASLSWIPGSLPLNYSSRLHDQKPYPLRDGLKETIWRRKYA
jgi:hypothetical protein